MEYGANLLEKSAVQRLRNSVVLRGVMCGEVAFGALGIQKGCEVAAGVLSTAVGPKALDVRSVLSLRPGRKCLVGLESFIFSA